MKANFGQNLNSRKKGTKTANKAKPHSDKLREFTPKELQIKACKTCNGGEDMKVGTFNLKGEFKGEKCLDCLLVLNYQKI